MRWVDIICQFQTCEDPAAHDEGMGDGSTASTYLLIAPNRRWQSAASAITWPY